MHVIVMKASELNNSFLSPGYWKFGAVTLTTGIHYLQKFLICADLYTISVAHSLQICKECATVEDFVPG